MNSWFVSGSMENCKEYKIDIGYLPILNRISMLALEWRILGWFRIFGSPDRNLVSTYSVGTRDVLSRIFGNVSERNGYFMVRYRITIVRIVCAPVPLYGHMFLRNVRRYHFADSFYQTSRDPPSVDSRSSCQSFRRLLFLFKF